MNRQFGIITATAAFACTSVALAGGSGSWADFAYESSRLVSGYGASNSDEKDFAWADLDMDGDTDLISVDKQLGTTTGRRRNVLYMNEGGVLTDRTAEFGSDSNVTLADNNASQGLLDLTNDRDVVIVDVNGDDWPDMVTATTLSSPFGKAISHPRVYINLGQSNGNPPPLTSSWLGFTFDDEDRTPTMPAEPRFCSVSAGDVDGDGDMDLYFGDYQQGGSRPVDLNDRLYINNGNGYFTDESSARMTAVMLESSFGMATAIADMNGDGVLDILKDDALNAPQGVSISYNNPANEGFYNVYEIPYNNAPYHITVGDLNNDGLLDVVVTDDGSDRFMLNTGNGPDGLANFQTKTFVNTNTGDFGGNQTIGDLNNDGLDDVFITSIDVDLPSCAVDSKVYRNLGPALGSVSLSHQGNIGISTSHMDGTHDAAIFDINGDGWNDIVLGNCTGTYVYMNQPPTGMQFLYPQGLPAFVVPDEVYTFQMQVQGIGVAVPTPNTGKIFYSVNDAPFVEQNLSLLTGLTYEVSLPAVECTASIDFYFEHALDGGGTETDPPNAPLSTYSVLAIEGTELTYEDDFELSNTDWTIQSTNLSTGEWERAIPIGTINSNGDQAAPDSDAEALAEKEWAYVTENGIGSAGSADVDGGPTRLISPSVDLSGTDAVVSYSQWMYSSSALTTGDDELVVEVSNDDGQNWTHVSSTTTTSEVWEGASFVVGDYVTPTDEVRVRFSVADSTPAGIVEAGIDLFRVEAFDCGSPCVQDISGNQSIDVFDLLAVLDTFGSCPDCPTICPEDITGDCEVDVFDILEILDNWGPCP